MKRKINCLYAPIFGTMDACEGYTAIRFPEEEKEEQDLVDIKNIEISNRVGHNDDFIRHIRDDTIDKPFGKPNDTIYAPTFKKALTWFEKLSR